MNTEDKLKDLILSRYKSIREFTIANDIPYTTLDSIFKRGVGNSSVSIVLKICNALHISADSLADGRIESTYDDDIQSFKNEFYEEIGEMSLTTDEIENLLRYAKSMRNAKSKYGNEIYKRIVDLDLPVEEMEYLLKYAEFMKSKHS